MIGFDTRSLKSFEVFFATKCNGDYVIDSSSEDTPISIIDLDIVKGKKVREELRNSYPEQVIVAVSILKQSDHDPRTIHIEKPVNHLELKQQLAVVKKAITTNNLNLAWPKDEKTKKKSTAWEKVTPGGPTKPAGTASKTVSHSTAAASLMTLSDDLHFVGDNPDIDLKSPEALTRITYSPSTRFQGAVIKATNNARRIGNPIEMICLNTGVIVDPVKNAVFTSVKDNFLRPLCLVSVDKIESLVELPKDYSGARIQTLSGRKNPELIRWSIEEFIWKITLWSSRGRIPEDTDIRAPVFLYEWPNFTRLVNFPHAMRIAALLHQHAVVLGDIPRHLNIPQRHVFSFYSAARVLGLVKTSQRRIEQTMEFPPTQKEVAPRSLLKKLLGRLVSSPDNKIEARSA